MTQTNNFHQDPQGSIPGSVFPPPYVEYKMESEPFNEKWLQELCAYWQKILRLQDWLVNIRYMRQWELADSGRVRGSLRLKTAKVDILHPDDYSPTTDVENEITDTVIHELMHLHFKPFATDSNEVFEEQAVASITSALLTLYREGRNVTTKPRV